LLRTREVLASQLNAVRQNLYQIQPTELAQLRRWIDFVLGMGVYQYVAIRNHTREVEEKMPEDEERDCQCPDDSPALVWGSRDQPGPADEERISAQIDVQCRYDE
jgi:hypothetical protein